MSIAIFSQCACVCVYVECIKLQTINTEMRMLMAFECNSQMHTISRTENRLDSTATGHTGTCTRALRIWTRTNKHRYKSSIYFEPCTLNAACWNNPTRRMRKRNEGVVERESDTTRERISPDSLFNAHHLFTTIVFTIIIIVSVVELFQPKIHIKQYTYTRIGVSNANDMIIFIFYFPTDSISNVKRASKQEVSERWPIEGWRSCR